ncbi:hypothetical protein DERP_011237 [Dermatophagoides pteronyssinus]|uniref:Uncharacterized protein n=1 Tax=Dermatophagoides pteronyssinus TaxID=6956 RepID=A0ABQ8JCI9_DERPT|nr:hypothetical protein DERP_011237 [Dermatophagoides pteronyssinus]
MCRRCRYSRYIEIFGVEIILQRVQRWRNGTYQCQCSNQQGQSLSNQLKLDIKFAPVCLYPYTTDNLFEKNFPKRIYSTGQTCF